MNGLRLCRLSWFVTVAVALNVVCAAAHGQAISSPNTSLYAGSPATTYNGSTGGAVCNAASGGLDTLGNGCLATAAHLDQPFGIAIDAYNNLYTADASYFDGEIRVVYQGGSALSAALIAANPAKTFTPTAGHIYNFGTLVGTTGTTPLTTPGAYCSGSAGPKTYDTLGDGCPAAYGVFTARDVFVDANGNIFFTSLPAGANYASGYASVRVIYVAGTQVASLIQGYNPSIATVNPGYIYALSASGDFIGSTSNTGSPQNVPSGIASIVADSSGNLYVSDTGTNAAVTGLGTATSGNQIKKLSVASPATGWTTYVGSGTGGSSATYAVLGDGGPATSAVVDAPTTLLMDANNNLYIADTGDSRVRVVYSGGVTPPLYVGTGSFSTGPSTIVTSPTVGDIYTVVGGVPYSSASTATSLGNLQALLTVDGVVSTTRPQAATFDPYSPVLLGMDLQGNLLVGGKMTYTSPVTNTILYRVAATTGTVNVLGGVDASNIYGTISTAPAAGVSCGSGTTGPAMTDAYGDGCPAIEVNPLVPYGRLVFDSSGSFYLAEGRGTSGTTQYSGGIVRKYTFPEKLGSTAVGSSITTTTAFGFPGTTSAPPVYSTTPTVSFTSTGNTTTEFADAGNDICSTYTYAIGTPVSVENCAFSVSFTPTQPGTRLGSIAVSSGSTALGTVALGGVGLGAELSVDPGTSTTIGSGLSPNGVGVDQAGNVYISDATSNRIYKSVGGAAPTAFSVTTGNLIKAPSQIAVGGNGLVYVADKGYNLLNAVTSAGVVNVVESAAVGGVALNGPTGAAVDALGNVYFTDTGNNRVVEYQLGGGNSVVAVTGLNAPRGLAIDTAGSLYIADSGNSRVVRYSAGVQTTVSSTTTFTTPIGVAVDAAGDLYVADSGSNAVYLLPSGSTTTTTLASGVTGLTGIAVDSSGDVFYTATSKGGAIEINRTAGVYAYPNTALGQTATTGLTLSNPGNTAFTTGSSLASGTDTTDFAVGSATTNGCSVSTPIAAGGSCGLSAMFQPQSVATLSDTVTFPGTTPGTSTSVALSGTGLSASNVATTITLSTTSPIAYGQTAMLVATVAPQTGTTAPAGTVTLTIDGSTTQTGTLTASGSNGAYMFQVASLQGGSHSFTAAYVPGAGYTASSTAASTPLTVGAAVLTVTGSCSNRIFGQVNVCGNAAVGTYQYADNASTVFVSTPSSSTTAQRNSVAGTYASVPGNTTLTAYGANDYTVNGVNGSFTISGGAVQSILFKPLPNFPHGASYQLTARTTSGLPVTYAVTAGNASVSGTTLTVSGTGSVTVQATSATDSTGDYAAASPVSVSFTAQ